MKSSVQAMSLQASSSILPSIVGGLDTCAQRYVGPPGLVARGLAQLGGSISATSRSNIQRMARYYTATPMKSACLLMLMLCPPILAQPAMTFPARQPRYAPKTARTLHTDEQIKLARENIVKYPSAAAVAQT